MYHRTIYKNIKNSLFQGKGVVIYGARQVGKTTLCKQILSEYERGYYLTADDPYTQQILTDKSISDYRALFGSYKIICIDEAQRIPNIGSILKLLIDNLPEVQVIATGSSSFDLANKVNEPLTGRIYTYRLHPLSIAEIVGEMGVLGFDQQIQQRIVYGMYPEAVAHNTHETLIALSESYVYKDVFAFDFIKKSDSIVKLLQTLAYQIGSQVSYNELAQTVGIDTKTVQKYIHILEQAFIIFRLPSFARNLRNELKKTQKIYFRDVGIRNSIIRRFATLDMRDDIGALRENFAIAETLKATDNQKLSILSYFWRSKNQQEIDLVQDYNGKIRAYEMKRSQTKKVSRPVIFIEAYKPACKVIHRGNRQEIGKIEE